MFSVWCDRIMLVWLYLLIFVLPASTAGVEIASAGAILCWLVKKVAALWSAGKVKNLPERSLAMEAAIRAPFSANSVYAPLALWVLISYVSIFFSWYPASSALAFFSKTLQAVFIFFCVQEVMVTDSRVRWFVRIFLVSGFILCLDGFWQLRTGSDIFKHLPPVDGRMSASFHHPNGLGAYLVPLIAAALYQTWQAYAAARKEKTTASLFGAALMTLLTAVSFLSMGLSMSRGAWLGMFVGFVFWGVVEKRTRWLVLACSLVFLIIFMPKIIHGRNYTLSASAQVSSTQVVATPIWQGTGRETFWRDALKIIRDNPLIGTGLNTYSQAIKHYVSTWQNYPHNSYLHMAAEIGIAGAAVFIWFILSLICLVLNSLRKIRDSRIEGLLIVLAAGFTGLSIESAVDTTLYSSQLDTLFWLIAGLCMVYSLAHSKPAIVEGR